MLSRLLPFYRNTVPASIREPMSRAFNWSEGSVVSFSAPGEDLFVRGSLDDMRLERTSIRCMDIDGNHPNILSNTFFFYRMGGSGVVVEPTPREATVLAARRPRDALVREGVAFGELGAAILPQLEPSICNALKAVAAEDKFNTIESLGHPIERRG